MTARPAPVTDEGVELLVRRAAPYLGAHDAGVIRQIAAERDELRTLVAGILDHFGPSGSGHTARVGQVQIAKWREAAGLETP